MSKRAKRSAKTRRKSKLEAKPFHPLYGYMKGLVRVMPGVDITEPADPGLADYLDTKYGKERPKN